MISFTAVVISFTVGLYVNNCYFFFGMYSLVVAVVAVVAVAVAVAVAVGVGVGVGKSRRIPEGTK